MKNLITMMSLSFIVLSLDLMAQSGGSAVGNGGDAIVCPSKTILLDSYEAHQRGFKIHLNGNGIAEKVEDLVNRFRLVDPYNGLKLKKYASEFLADLDNTATFTSDDLSDINDSLELSLPRGCKIEQMVIQRKVTLPFESHLLIKHELWSALSEDDQVLTVLHEAYYKLLIEYGAKDSRLARYFNSIFASNISSKVTLESYSEMLESGLALGVAMPMSFSFKKFPTLEDRIFIIARSPEYTFGKILFNVNTEKMVELGLCKAGKNNRASCLKIKDRVLGHELYLHELTLVDGVLSFNSYLTDVLNPKVKFKNGSLSFRANFFYHFVLDQEGYLITVKNIVQYGAVKATIDGRTFKDERIFYVNRAGELSL